MSESKKKKIGISSRLDIAGKVSELESSNRKYLVGNTEGEKKAKKYKCSIN